MAESGGSKPGCRRWPVPRPRAAQTRPFASAAEAERSFTAMALLLHRTWKASPRPARWRRGAF